MLSTKQVTLALESFCIEVMPELEGSYDYSTDEQYKGLPDVAIEVQDLSVGAVPVSSNLRQIQQIEQARTFTWNVQILIIVPPEPAADADTALKDLTDRFISRVLLDKTLGGRVSWVGDSPRASFLPPFVEFEDGTQGRFVTLYLQVGQMTEV